MAQGEPSARLSTDRRTLLRGSLAAAAALPAGLLAGTAPALARSGRPEARWGVQAGDVTATSALVWAPPSRPP